LPLLTLFSFKTPVIDVEFQAANRAAFQASRTCYDRFCLGIITIKKDFCCNCFYYNELDIKVKLQQEMGRSFQCQWPEAGAALPLVGTNSIAIGAGSSLKRRQSIEDNCSNEDMNTKPADRLGKKHAM
jgi:hypothetical protein